MIELDKAMYAFLAGDTAGGNGIADISIGGIHQVVIPTEGATIPPYTVFRAASGVPTYTFGFTRAFSTHVYAVQGYAVNTPTEDGLTTVARMSDRLETIFLNASLALTSKVLMGCAPLQEIAPQREFDENQNRWIFSRGVLVEAWLTN